MFCLDFKVTTLVTVCRNEKKEDFYDKESQVENGDSLFVPQCCSVQAGVPLSLKLISYSIPWLNNGLVTRHLFAV